MAVIDDVIQQRARAAVEVIARHARVRAAYLFGSYVTGTADQFSDIDIAVFVEDADQWDLERRVSVAVEVQKEVGDDVEPHFFPAESFENPPKASFAAYILRHAVLIEG